MGYIIFIILILLGVILIYIISAITSSKKLKSKIEESFGKEPIDQDYKIESIASYHHYMNTTMNNFNWIDDITWNDLDMDKVFKRINLCDTSVGEEYLYHILHVQCFSIDEVTKREKLLSYLKVNDMKRLDLQIILSKLGKTNYTLSAFIDTNELKQLKHPNLYNALALLPLVGIILIPFIQSIGIIILISSFIVNIMIFYYLKGKIEIDMISLEYFASILWCCNKICSIDDNNFKPFIVDLKSNFKVFKAVGGKISIVSKKGFSDLDIITEYFKILFMSDIRNYNKIVQSISNNITCFHKLYRDLGKLDTAISILSFRESLPFFCIPQFHEKKSVIFNGLYHPLLSAPISNKGNINNNCIITGSNASGKSTFIKSIAINGILAQTINTCTAHSYLTRFSLVITSMAVHDNISDGDSYFVAEIKSLKRILDKITETPCLCFIDEILKGTNTIERIACSAAVLKYLSDKDCLCMVASHDIELTEILKNQYDNYHFSDQITSSGVFFDYLLKQGKSQTRNAIKLLHFMDFDDMLIENAESLVKEFISTHKW